VSAAALKKNYANMIWTYIFIFISSVLNGVFSFLPTVTTLPTIFGINLDAQLTGAVGVLNDIGTYYWPIRDLFVAVAFFLTYRVIMLVIRFFIGHRAPQ
jgi:hypothetical protein